MKDKIVIALSKRDTSFIKSENLDPVTLALAFIKAESSFNPWVSRYEPNYKWLLSVNEFAKKLNITPETERIHQKTSWGLFQIMGAVAREYGYKDYLHLLATTQTPEIQVDIWLRHLKRLYNHYGDIKLAISGYNAGFALKEPTGYYYKIMKAYAKLDKK